MNKKKSSMYLNDYETIGYMPSTTNTEESKQNYLNYIQSLINELIELKYYAENADPKTPIDMFYNCQDRLIKIKNKLNAKTLAEWHNNISNELREEAERNVDNCINCKHCIDIDEYERNGYCKMWVKKVLVHLDEFNEFEIKENIM